MLIYCCECSQDIDARLTDGSEIYPHRSDLSDLPMWVCDQCKNYVGCHYKTRNPTKPLGVIPSLELRNARKHIHAKLDPIWKTKRLKRGEIYALISGRLGYEYHTAEIRSIEEARRVYRVIADIHEECRPF